MKVRLVVHPYGHVDDTRSKTEVAGLNAYFGGVVSLICQNVQKIDRVIVAGGMIKDGVVEADSVAADLRRRLDEVGCAAVVMPDGASKSTISIVEAAVVSVQGESEVELWQTADNWRWLKTKYLTWYFCRKHGVKAKTRVFGFYRQDTARQSNHLYQFVELVALMVLGPDRIKNRIERDR